MLDNRRPIRNRSIEGRAEAPCSGSLDVMREFEHRQTSAHRIRSLLVDRQASVGATRLRNRLRARVKAAPTLAQHGLRRSVKDPATHNCTRCPGILHFSYSRPRDLGVRPRGIGIRLRATRQRGSRPRSALTHQGCPRNCFVAWRRHSREEFGPVGWPRPSSREVTVHDRGWDDVRSSGCCKPSPR